MWATALQGARSDCRIYVGACQLRPTIPPFRHDRTSPKMEVTARPRIDSTYFLYFSLARPRRKWDVIWESSFLLNNILSFAIVNDYRLVPNTDTLINQLSGQGIRRKSRYGGLIWHTFKSILLNYLQLWAPALLSSSLIRSMTFSTPMESCIPPSRLAWRRPILSNIWRSWLPAQEQPTFLSSMVFIKSPRMELIQAGITWMRLWSKLNKMRPFPRTSVARFWKNWSLSLATAM